MTEADIISLMAASIHAGLLAQWKSLPPDKDLLMMQRIAIAEATAIRALVIERAKNPPG